MILIKVYGKGNKERVSYRKKAIEAIDYYLTNFRVEDKEPYLLLHKRKSVLIEF